MPPLSPNPTPSDEVPSVDPMRPLDELADEVPTARNLDGQWIVGAMPSADVVTRFVDLFTIGSSHHIQFGPYATASDDPSNAAALLDGFNRWWRSYRDSDASIDDWAVALDASEQALIDQACAALSSIHIDLLVAGL